MKRKMRFPGLIKNKSGGIATVSALMSVPLMFVVGISVDYSIMSNLQSALQNSADLSALASAKELALSSNKDSTVKEIAKQYVLSSLSNGFNLEKHQDALSIETTVSDTRKSVSVNLSLKWQPLVLKYVKPDSFPLRVKAMATLAGNENICIIALGSTLKQSLLMSGVSSINASGCAIYSNSVSSKGISLKNTSKLQSSNTYTAGGYAGPESNYKPRPVVNAPNIIDPLKDRIPPKSSNCRKNNYFLDEGREVLYPGTYCGGIFVTGRASIDLKPGVYIMKGGPLMVKGLAKLRGKNVGFVFEGNDSILDFSSESTISMTAPKSGPLAGILFFENRDSSLLRKFTVHSRNAEQFEGTVYLPNGQFLVARESRIGDSSKWTAIIANKITVANGARLKINSDYSGSSVPVPEGVGPQGTVARLAR